jgi:2-iminobutanoate/2-iminopropanoate deaminase
VGFCLEQSSLVTAADDKRDWEEEALNVSKRQSIYVDSFVHKNPTPAACRIGDIVYSGGIHGFDPETMATSSEGMDKQCELMFSHVRTIVEAAGLTTDDIIKITILMKDRSQRDMVNPHWVKMFPDPANRPTRQAVQADLQGGMLVQCDFVAVASK